MKLVEKLKNVGSKIAGFVEDHPEEATAIFTVLYMGIGMNIGTKLYNKGYSDGKRNTERRISDLNKAYNMGLEDGKSLNNQD